MGSIENYRQKVLALEPPITPAAIAKLNNSFKLSSEDIAAIQKQANAHFERGRNYLDLACLEEAIEELSKATELAPLNLKYLHSLSEAFQQRYQESDTKQTKEQYRAKVLATAQRCLAVDSKDEKATALVKAFKAKQPLAIPKKIGVTAIKLVVAAFVISGVGFVVWLPMSLLEYQPAALEQDKQNKDKQNNIATAERLASNSTGSEQLDGAVARRNDSSAGTNSQDNNKEVDIPIEFDRPGIDIDPRLSRLNNYTERSFYKLQAVLINNSDQEIDELQLKIEYLNDSGTVIAADTTEAVSDFNAIIRPNDQRAFDVTKEIPSDLAAVRLSIVTINQLPAASSYPPPTPIAYDWAFSQPAQLTFDLAARSEKLTTNTPTYFDAEWELTNTSETAIRALKLQVNLYDSIDKIISTRDIYAVATSGAPMLPGEVRPLRIFKEVTENYARYEVTVIDAE